MERGCWLRCWNRLPLEQPCFAPLQMQRGQQFFELLLALSRLFQLILEACFLQDAFPGFFIVREQLSPEVFELHASALYGELELPCLLGLLR